jgi:hypothetical protein
MANFSQRIEDNCIYEIAPPTTQKTQGHSGDVHPRLKEMQSADVRLPIGGYAQYENKA